MSENTNGPGRSRREEFTVSRSDVGETSLGVAVTGAVAARSDTNALRLDPLSDVVDVDALDALWGPRGADPDHGVERVTFRYMDHEVTVTPETLRLRPLDPAE